MATGPDWPSAIASSADRRPTPFVRASQIGFSLSIDSYWSTAPGHHLAELAALREEAAWDVFRQAADLEVARVHARTGDELEEIEDAVAFAERVPERRDRAQLQRGGAEPDEVRMDAVQLGRGASASRPPSAAPRCRAASRSPSRTRARWPGTRRNPCAARTGSPSTTSSAPSTSRSPCAGSR